MGLPDNDHVTDTFREIDRVQDANFVYRARESTIYSIYCMVKGCHSATLVSIFLIVAHADLFGQADEGAPVDVGNVRFSYVRPAGGSDNWMEATIELDVRGTREGNPGFVDSVRVALNLGLQSTMAGENGFVFYRSEAEASTLESGAARFRFYLPAAVVRRYQLSGDPFAFTVDVWIDGKLLPKSGAAVSPNLTTLAALRDFQDRVARDAIRNDGILVPQYDTPFLIEYARDTPAFVRRNR
jgi:hypothetical protein